MAGFAPALSQRRRRRPLIVACSGAERKAGACAGGLTGRAETSRSAL